MRCPLSPEGVRPVAVVLVEPVQPSQVHQCSDSVGVGIRSGRVSPDVLALGVQIANVDPAPMIVSGVKLAAIFQSEISDADVVIWILFVILLDSVKEARRVVER
jgi:hypothetical protein